MFRKVKELFQKKPALKRSSTIVENSQIHAKIRKPEQLRNAGINGHTNKKIFIRTPVDGVHIVGRNRSDM